MDFDLAPVRQLLQRQGRVSYRALKLRFQLDDETLAALKDELIYAERVDGPARSAGNCQRNHPARGRPRTGVFL